jgi:hypothetical protein
LLIFWLKVFEIAPTFLMVDIQRAAGDAAEYLKVSCLEIDLSSLHLFTFSAVMVVAS